MDVVLRDLTGTECWGFIDDLILFSDTIEEHARRLEHVLRRLDRANLQLQPAKCVSAQAQVQYLGYVVSRDGITASPDKLEAVRRYAVPKNAVDIRSSLGLASFYKRLVPKFAEIAKPLTELIRKDVQFKWEERQQTAFKKIKRFCVQSKFWPTLILTQFVLTTDASRVAVAGLLSQVQMGWNGQSVTRAGN